VTLPDIPALYAEHGTTEKVAEALGCSPRRLEVVISVTPGLYEDVEAAKAEWARRADTR
jgi:hypothetical protein